MNAEPTQHPEDHPGKPHPVTVAVNGHPVELEDHKVTGLQIKQAAVEQGVIPDVGFQLSEERQNGEIHHVRDDEHIVVNDHSSFLAVAPDDNS